MSKESIIRVGISIGDLNGIGPEVILKTFEDNRMFDFCTPIVFANSKLVNFFKRQLKLKTQIQPISSLNKIVDGKLNVINVWEESVQIEYGKEDTTIGGYAIKSLEAATLALKENAIDTLVTAPIHKTAIQSDTFKFPGHTDYLNQELEGDSLMFMVTDDLKVGLLTDHVALTDIVKHLTPGAISQKISTIHTSLVKDFGIVKPKIAVLGINPHTGDNGVIGKEDDEILRPTLEKIKIAGKLVYGPYAADSFFGSNNYKQFDAVVATYHDQGLIPFKTLSFGQGVNYTAGLNKVRTSPDHGTAFEIAGQGIADSSSFSEAVFRGITIFKNRAIYDEISLNPLKKQHKKRTQVT